MSDIIEKIYYRIEFENVSALNIGSGRSDKTDKDILLDKLGKPFIPATTVAGVSRQLFDDKTIFYYFGNELCEVKPTEELTESKIVFYDAKLISDNFVVTNRDNVKLDKFKTAVSGSKFDYEIIEPGAKFLTYIEQNILSDEKDRKRDIGNEICKAWQNGMMSFGSKTARGLGRTKVTNIDKVEFSFENEGEINQWLDFDLFDNQGWQSFEIQGEFIDDALHIDIDFTLNESLIIRNYTTQQGESTPDYEQMMYGKAKTGKDGKINASVVIPGTSWAGAIKHGMEKLCPGITDEHFGIAGKKKSQIQFSESQVYDGILKTVTRNSVDRFTGGAADKALFTERFYYGGKTVLHIDISKSAYSDEKFMSCFAAVLTDIHMGMVAVGGETAVGRGIFSVEEIIIKSGATGSCEMISIKPDKDENIYSDIYDGYRLVI